MLIVGVYKTTTTTTTTTTKINNKDCSRTPLYLIIQAEGRKLWQPRQVKTTFHLYSMVLSKLEVRTLTAHDQARVLWI